MNRGMLAAWLLIGCSASLDRDASRADSASAAGNPKLAFWDRPRKGANCQNQSVEPAYWQAARAAGIEFIRLAPDAWAAERRDFLLGSADACDTLNAVDLRLLWQVLDDAHGAGIPVVLAMFSLPGARWRQLNDGKEDSRLWKLPGFRDQACRFWRQLAAALRDHPAIVAYNPLNEPHPERAYGLDGAAVQEFAEWYREVRGTAADLNGFNREIVAAIRAADAETPILLDGWSYASPAGLCFLEPVADPGILYAFHHYEPWEYTTFRVNQDRYSYPAQMPHGWTPQAPAQLLDGVSLWAEKHAVPSTRIVASEFGVDRRVQGAREYLEDVIALLDRHGWHWAFYAYREDGSWGGMDYELGAGPLGAAFWEAVDRGEDPESLKRRGPNPLWETLARRFAPQAR